MEAETLRRGRRWIWPLAVAILIIAASHRPQLVSTGISGGDKVVHFLVYGLLATLLCRIGSGWRAAAWALMAASLFGAADEWHQSFIPGRSAELADWLADTLGAGVAVTLYTRWKGYRDWMEKPLWRPPRDERP